MRLALALGLIAGLPVATNATGLLGDDPSAYTTLGNELRSLFQDQPEIIAKAMRGPVPYADEIAADLKLIASHSQALFGPHRASFGASEPAKTMAILVRPACPDCIATLADLRNLSSMHPNWRFVVIDLPDDPTDTRPKLMANILRTHGFDAAQTARLLAAQHPDWTGDDLARFLSLSAPSKANNPSDSAVIAELGLDLFPSYILPEMMIRGQMPTFVLQRYLSD
ncbi:hypothetical protein [Pseudoprimorskyibacter insulae]|uniref:Thioredoxin-like fold domain-containing protein n=1 Tax=Pseudoprimorskyibacter insulae TaxID=1695997 RepID=A0A2R8AXD3_9RHOB|nr:hypothetical protein [Pseudoprimorskyibacter insulae]SPF80715.1 hypothetical protein PRI8871_02526 [Pseudoprimorskyibacter insulae]